MSSNNITNQVKPENSNESRMHLLMATCHYLRNTYPTPGDRVPLIGDSAPLGVAATAAILVAANGGPFVHEGQLQTILQQEREKNA
jgi:hypothetical protein